LTSKDVARRAEATSFEAIARHAEVRAAAAEVDRALIGYLPKLTGTARYTRLSKLPSASLGNLVVAPGAPTGSNPPADSLIAVPINFPQLSNQYLLQASLVVPISDYFLRVQREYSAAVHSERAAKLTEQATRLGVKSSGKLAYYSWVRARLQQVVAQDALVQAQAHLEDTRRNLDAGTASRGDAFRAESQVASAELLLEKAIAMADRLADELRIIMHDPNEANYAIGETLEPAPVDVARPLASMWDEAVRLRPELRAMDANAEALAAQAKETEAGYFPRLDGFGDYIYANPNPRIFPQQDTFRGTWDVGVQLTWTPNDVGTAAASHASAVARLESLRAQRRALEDNVKREVSDAQRLAREAARALETTKVGLAAAEESYRVRRSLFQNGRATGVEVTDAEADLTRARLEAINARVDLCMALVRLEHALGRDAI
jgi:outer membrane protein TolC